MNREMSMGKNKQPNPRRSSHPNTGNFGGTVPEHGLNHKAKHPHPSKGLKNPTKMNTWPKGYK